MGNEKLRTWLKLADGPWPPNYYILVGLQVGEGKPEEIEARILERLELLRRYQLPHPDEATEGMNLLARALDCLTNPEAKREYDRSLGLKPAVPEKPAEPVDDLLDTLFADVHLLPAETGEAPTESILPDSISLPDVEDEMEPEDEPDFVEATDLPDGMIVEGDEADKPTAPPPLPNAILLLEAKYDPDPPPLPAKAPKIQVTQRKRSSRPRSRARDLYADLARIRKVLRLWERARPYVTDLDRTFNRRTDSVALMGWLAEVRPLLPTVDDLIGQPNQPGNIVAVMARQQLVVDMFRSLLPSQRESLAKDFRAAHYRLAQEYDELRNRVRRRTEKDFVRAVWNPFLKHLGDYPEWFLLVASLIILAIATVRSL